MEDYKELFYREVVEDEVPYNYNAAKTNIRDVVLALAKTHKIYLQAPDNTVYSYEYFVGGDVVAENETTKQQETVGIDEFLDELPTLLKTFKWAKTTSPLGSLEDRYTIGELLGEGATGKVYKGTRKQDNRVVAIKIYATSTNKSLAQYVEKEFKILKNLGQCTMFLCYVEHVPLPNGDTALVTDYLDGDDFSALVTNQVDESLIEDLAQQCFEALKFIHARMIAHRDIKPANIFYVTDGTIRLIDFGLACYVCDCSGAPGTPLYIDPRIMANREQYKNNKDYQHLWMKGDVYSMGLTLLELCRGKIRYNPAGNMDEQLKTIKSVKLRDSIKDCLNADIYGRKTAAEILELYF